MVIIKISKFGIASICLFVAAAMFLCYESGVNQGMKVVLSGVDSQVKDLKSQVADLRNPLKH